MFVHEVLVNRLGGLSLPGNSVFRLTDRPDMTLDIYRGRKTTPQQQLLSKREHIPVGQAAAAESSQKEITSQTD